ncbi:MAG: hypothetical protein ACT4QG_02000 [Sporichthyaceae bacterium]
MNKSSVVFYSVALVVGGGLTAMGIALAEEEPETQTVAISSPAEEKEPAQRTDYDNIPGMAMGTPPQTAQLNCSTTKVCDAVFIVPTKQTVKPFGMTVKLLKATPKKATFSVNGKTYAVAPGKTVKVKGATVKVVGTPGTVVTLNFAKP